MKKKSYAIPINRKDVVLSKQFIPVENIITRTKKNTSGIINMDLIGLLDLITEISSAIKEEKRKTAMHVLNKAGNMTLSGEIKINKHVEWPDVKKKILKELK